MNVKITFNGVLIPIEELKSTIPDAEIKKILKKLTIKGKIVGRKTSQYSAPIIKHAYKIEKIDNIKYLVLPRIALTHFSTYKTVIVYENIQCLEKFELNLESELQLYPYQQIAVDYLFQLNTNVAYLQMDTGLGKSRVGCAIIVKKQEPAIVVVPTQAIAEQWLSEFEEMYPSLKVIIYSTAADLAIIENNKKMTLKNKLDKIKPVINTTNYNVFIIIINTFREKDSDFIKNFGTIVLDEAHEYHSSCNCKALWLSQTKFVLGLSATPDERPDELDKYIQLHLGSIIYPKDIPNFDISSVNFKGCVRTVEYEGADKYCEAVLTPAGTISAILTITNILNDPYRLALVVKEIKRLNTIHLTEEGASHGLIDGKKHGIFVFAERRDFLITLRDALAKEVGLDEILAPELADAGLGRQPLGSECCEDAESNDEEELENLDDELDENLDEDLSENLDEDLDNSGSRPRPVPRPASAAISVLRGGISKNTMVETRKAKAHIVLTTYGYSRRGISLPDMTSLVLVSPRRNGMRQIIGRILRRNSDETIIRQIVDIVDVCTVLKGQFAERKKIYIEKFGKKNMSKVEFKWNQFE